MDVDASVRTAGRVERGVDLVDVSSGGAVAHQQIKPAPGYQAGFAEQVKRDAGVLTGAVGLLTSATQPKISWRMDVRMRSSWPGQRSAIRTGGSGLLMSSATKFLGSAVPESHTPPRLLARPCTTGSRG